MVNDIVYYIKTTTGSIALNSRVRVYMNNYIKEVSTGAVGTTTIVGHVISKGGVGKTTVTMFQAMRLADQGKSVLIVDIDPQEDLSKSLIPATMWEKAKRDCFSSANLLVDKKRTNTISVISSPYIENIDIIPASEMLLTERNLQIDRAGEGKSGSERTAAVNTWIKSTAKGMRQYLLTLPYDYIFFNFSPSTSLLQMMFVWCLDVAFIPIENDYREIEMVNKTLTRLKASKREGFVPNVRAYVYLNKYDKPATHKTQESVLELSIQKIQSTYKDSLIKPFIPLSQTIHKAGLERRMPWVKAPTGQAAKVGRVVRDAIDEMNAKFKQGSN